MKLAHLVAPHRMAFALGGGLALAAACSRTSDPVEHYATARPVTTATGGKSQSTGGKSTGSTGSSGSSGQAASMAGTGGGGGSEPLAMAGEGGGPDMVEPMPPTDYGCGDAPVSTEAFTRRALRSAAAECAQWHYCRFEGGAQVLADELSVHASAPTTESHRRVTAAYAQAFELASANELFQFGPFASQAESAFKDAYQGQGLRELMYGWPASARCTIEEQVALRAYAKSMKGVRVSARGMFALDYLLYYGGTDTACAATSSIGQAWAMLSEDELAASKLDYATALGDDIHSQAQALRGAWAADGGNFGPVFVDTTGYPSEAEAMKVLAWALLYVEREVKDWKLGIPTGHTLTEPGPAEATFSGLKLVAIRENLRGFRRLYQGCGPAGEGLGFDDWLTEAGHPELAQEIVDAYVLAQAAADSSPELDLATPAELEHLYQEVKRLTDLLKNDLFGAGSPIGLTLPKGIEGDTD